MSDRIFPASRFTCLLGQRLVGMSNVDYIDEGLVLTFQDGAVLTVGFTRGSGDIGVSLRGQAMGGPEKDETQDGCEPQGNSTQHSATK